MSKDPMANQPTPIQPTPNPPNHDGFEQETRPARHTKQLRDRPRSAARDREHGLAAGGVHLRDHP